MRCAPRAACLMGNGPRSRVPAANARRLRALLAAREGAVSARTAALNQLRDLLVTTPEPLRNELRPLSRARLLARLTSARPDRRNRSRAPWHSARPQGGRATHSAADGRGTRTRPRDRAPHLEARSPAARPARHRTAARRPAPSLLVTPRTPQKRSGLRPPRRRSPDPRLFWPNDPLPARPRRRPETQPHPPPDHRHPPPLAPADDRLHQPANPTRKEPPRSDPLPQALPRPQSLPAPRAPASDDLTNIEASLIWSGAGELPLARRFLGHDHRHQRLSLASGSTLSTGPWREFVPTRRPITPG